MITFPLHEFNQSQRFLTGACSSQQPFVFLTTVSEESQQVYLHMLDFLDMVVLGDEGGV